MIVFTDLTPNTILWFFTENQHKFGSLHIMDMCTIRMHPDIPKLYGVYPSFDLISKEALTNFTEEAFDYEYSNYLVNGPGFLTMVYVAGREYYHGNDLHVYLIDRSEFRDSVIECFQKVLFSRYGINSAIASSAVDLCSMDIDSSLSVNGLMNIGMDIDKAVEIDKTLIERMML